MTDYYVATTGSDTTGDGSSGSPWATINKARGTMSSSADNTVYIAAGTYDESYTGSFGPALGYTWVYQAQGAVTIRVAVDSTQPYCFRSNGAGAQEWRGQSATQKMAFDATNSPKGSTAYFFYENLSATSSLLFEDCSADGNAKFVGGIGGPETVTFRRCHLSNMTSYLGYLVSSELILESCFVDSCTSISCSYNAAGVGLTLKNCTIVSTTIQDTGASATTPAVTLLNTLFIDCTLGLSGVTTLVQGGNAAWKTTTRPAPRTAAYYTEFQFSGTVSSVANDLLWIDPDFDATVPELTTSSLCIGRGVSGGMSTDIYGATYATETIGCHFPSGGTKNYLTPTANHWMLVGDSWTYGTGVVSESARYGNVLEGLLTTKTFQMMPGDTSRHCGIHGMQASDIVLMASELAQEYTPEVIVFIGGVNDISNGENTDTVTDTIKFGLANLSSLYSSPQIIYGGTQIQDADSVSPNTTNADTVETAVHSYWTGLGYKSSRLTYNLQLQTGWNSDTVPPGLYNVDDLHLNDDGYAWLAGIIAEQNVAKLPFQLGSTEITSVSLGSNSITAIYYGSTQVWP